MEATIAYLGYIGIMEKKMETAIVYYVYGLPQMGAACIRLFKKAETSYLRPTSCASSTAGIQVATGLYELYSTLLRFRM